MLRLSIPASAFHDGDRCTSSESQGVGGALLGAIAGNAAVGAAVGGGVGLLVGHMKGKEAEKKKQ